MESKHGLTKRPSVIETALLWLIEYKRTNRLLEDIIDTLRFASSLLLIVSEDAISNLALSLNYNKDNDDNNNNSSYNSSDSSDSKSTSGSSSLPTLTYSPSSPVSNNRDNTSNSNSSSNIVIEE